MDCDPRASPYCGLEGFGVGGVVATQFIHPSSLCPASVFNWVLGSLKLKGGKEELLICAVASP